MFGLIYNFYSFCKKKAERKITIALLGLDNAGKTTLLNTVQGEVDKDTTPTFGFNSSTLQEGKYKVEVFDLGGGKSIRSVWQRYLAEVHAIVYVVDAADAQRFEDAKKTLSDVLGNQYMGQKPVLVYANKQDLPTAATAAEVVKSLGLASCSNSYNVFACIAKAPAGQPADSRLRDGLRWLISTVDREFRTLDPRVQSEAEQVRQEEARKKKEREERLRRQREERLRLQKEEEERARETEKANELHDGLPPAISLSAAASTHAGAVPAAEPEVLHPPDSAAAPEPADPVLQGMSAPGLPNTIESPGKLPVPIRRPLGVIGPDAARSNGGQGPGRPSSGGRRPGSAGGTPVPQDRSGLPPLAAEHAPQRPSATQLPPLQDSAAPRSLAASRAASASSRCGSRSGSKGGSPRAPGGAEAADQGVLAAGAVAEAAGCGDSGSEERTRHAHRPRLGASSGGAGGPGESCRGSFSLVHQNKVVPEPE